MFQQILVPLDGSACSEQALVLAARLARAVDGTLYLLRIANQEYTYASTSVAGIFVPADLAEMTDLEMKGIMPIWTKSRALLSWQASMW
ncbi:hypothetical protein KSC_066910 [Ktedonobacter sp. SOSP1-52]|uniref:universal stress protein n=1 Tax=Ktedonobacter sp. SOSP1-52 TaxID=2778366 RepID=UPI001915B272|nr:universal stress protein [Ktedonobacter sp. SOSP1-52]GHO67799.1 hypothetical protein KSC_066910 [Ktedonobacter sp. SOSP1-52]